MLVQGICDGLLFSGFCHENQFFRAQIHQGADHTCAFLQGFYCALDDRDAALLADGAEAEAAQRAAMAQVAGRGSRGVWDLGWAARGPAVEQRLGANLPNGFPTIDRFQNGLATSIKSMDMVSASGGATGTQYITTTGRGYIDAVAAFQGGSRTNQATGITTRITSSQVRGRALDLAIPSGANGAQRTALEELIEYGRQRGVTVNIIEFPF